MSEYRFHLQKYKYGSKISCPSCGNPDALSNMSMQKERLPFLAMSVSVITRIAVAIIIHPKNILNITPFVYNHSRLGIAHASMALLSTQPFISRIILMY